MAHALTIDPATGALDLAGLTRLVPGSGRAEAEAALAAFASGGRDFGNGYAWLYFDGFEFGGESCSLGLCYFEGRLTMAMWGVLLPGASTGDWPSPEECEAEVAFVRAELRRQLDRSFAGGEERFPWGAAYSLYDPKGGSASSGVRYS
ncbi:MAG TPA: hypothetical protein VEC11_05905 [Allosphingosinicella sp.]|nr:hypothetical protein [Allosphingosinicella sp.]